MHIQTGIALRDHTTFHIGGPADFFVSVRSGNELQDALQYAHEHSIPYTILGGGSNVLVSDSGVRGIVIHIDIGGVEYIAREGDSIAVRVGAGVVLDTFIGETVEKGYWGLENLSAIPGSVGATPIQNVGAYGVEVSSVIESVTVWNAHTNTEEILTATECQFGYRSSVFKTAEGKKYIVTSVTFLLSKVPRPHTHYADLVKVFSNATPTQIDIRKKIIEIRSAKFPDWRVIGTAGSFFKNPLLSNEHFLQLKEKYPDLPGYETEDATVKVPLGWILDNILHVRGTCDGDVCSYEGQALVIVNTKHASAEDVKKFAQKISDRVFDACHFFPEWEVRELK